MAKVLMYATGVCPYCVMAERLLRGKGVADIEKVRVDLDPARREEMMTRTGRRTVPQIYIGDRHVGGFDDLAALERAGGLDPLLAVFDQHDFDGHLEADCDGRLAGKTFAALFHQPGLNCDFTITQGVLRNTDLEKAARLIKLDSKSVGETPFVGRKVGEPFRGEGLPEPSERLHLPVGLGGAARVAFREGREGEGVRRQVQPGTAALQAAVDHERFYQHGEYRRRQFGEEHAAGARGSRCSTASRSARSGGAR